MSDHAPLPSGFGAGLVRKEEPGPSAPVLTGGFGAVVLSADLSDLNDQQRAAADAPAEGVDLIIAGAGCGKTKTILKRAEKLYFERPGVIGIISFARSVKEELTERIEKTVNPRVASNIKVMTNHAIGLRLVKNNLKTLGLPANTDVVSHDWQIAKLVKDRIEFEAGNPGQRTPHYDLGFNQFTDVQIKALFRAEEKMYAEGIDLTVILGANPNTVGEARDVWKVKSDAETVINSFKKVLKDTPVDRIISFIVWARMVRMLSGKLMFRDLLPLAALLPADCYTIFGFTHVLVDEAQDLSVDQHTVIQKLASVVGSMTFVGDPGQCIYRFSGARPDLFLDIPIRYPGTRTHFLEVNYRSKEPILDLANHVLHNYLGAPLSLLPNGAQKGDPIEVLDATRVNLVNWLGDLRYQKGVHWRDISVLFRGNAQAIDVEIALANANIPYNCWSGSFFEHKATDDYMAYIRFFGGDAPVQQDWETIVGHMKFLGKKSAEESWAATSDPKKLLTAPAPAACRSGAQKKRWSELQTFCRMLVAAMQPGNAGGDYLTLIAEHVKTTWEDRWADDPEKLEDARSIGEAFKAWAGVRRPADILDDMERMNSQDPDGVTLSTVHKFKGLERDYTGLWFVGLGPRDGMSKFPKTFMSSDQQEEMCIFYVGATRPRLGLTIFRGWTKTKEDPEPVPMTLPYGIEELFCTTGLLFARHGTQTACELCEHQFNCLARKR